LFNSLDPIMYRILSSKQLLCNNYYISLNSLDKQVLYKLSTVLLHYIHKVTNTAATVSTIQLVTYTQWAKN